MIGYDGEGNSVAAKDGAITLLHQGVGEHTKYNEMDKWNGYPYYAYSGSMLQQHIESWLYVGERAKLSEKEQEAILPRTLEGVEADFGDDDYDPNKIYGDTVEGALLWPLSVAEAEKVPESARAVAGGSVFWWLRTPGETQEDAECLGAEGSILFSGYAVTQMDVGVRPAIWVKIKD